MSNQRKVLLVAASNSSEKVKQIADFVCDGVDDLVELQAAIDLLGVDGGTIKFDGYFNFSEVNDQPNGEDTT